ncbi:MAG: MarC family protein [Candidatus Altiarchaeota archaeon]|nr:MarC family protein [Candidatus Altiarchaeota archaeon]
MSTIIAFLVMLNPFALFLYLEPVRKDLDHKSFLKVIFKATVQSFIICLLFFYAGNTIFQKIFQINFESFRIFGGIIIFSFAYHFIVKGQKALIMMKENLDDLASEIALPFMVGAGTISLSILLSHEVSYILGTLALLIIFILNFIILFLLKSVRDSIEKRKIKTAFDKNMEILLRLNGFFIGAIGIDMIVTGINNLSLIG